jgi:hypothetical protein
LYPIEKESGNVKQSTGSREREKEKEEGRNCKRKIERKNIREREREVKLGFSSCSREGEESTRIVIEKVRLGTWGPCAAKCESIVHTITK